MYLVNKTIIKLRVWNDKTPNKSEYYDEMASDKYSLWRHSVSPNKLLNVVVLIASISCVIPLLWFRNAVLEHFIYDADYMFAIFLNCSRQMILEQNGECIKLKWVGN